MAIDNTLTSLASCPLLHGGTTGNSPLFRNVFLKVDRVGNYFCLNLLTTLSIVIIWNIWWILKNVSVWSRLWFSRHPSSLAYSLRTWKSRGCLFNYYKRQRKLQKECHIKSILNIQINLVIQEVVLKLSVASMTLKYHRIMIAIFKYFYIQLFTMLNLEIKGGTTHRVLAILFCTVTFLTNSLKFIKVYIIRKGISQGRQWWS